jgi:hypothetical protein
MMYEYIFVYIVLSLIIIIKIIDSIIRNSVCTPAKLPCRRVEVGYEK